VLYIFLGDDDYSQAQAIKRLQEALGPEDMASLNTERLETQGLTPGDLIARCSAAPFLAMGRLVLVRGLLATFDQEGGGRRKASPDALKWKALADFVPTMPPTTTLVIQDGRIRDTNPLLKMLRPAAEVQTFALLRGQSLVGWVRERVRQEKGRIAPDAAQRLVDLVGGNLWVMSGEVEKLILYCQGRQITVGDVEKLSGYTKEEQIFALADAFIERRYPLARRQLARLVESGPVATQVIRIFAMQIGRLIQAKDVQERGGNRQTVQKELGLQDWLADKTLRQAQGYGMGALLALHRRLLETDMSIKTGRLTEEEALELLLAEALNRG
jgi:DNA polymerase-3 subunit delta